LKMPRRLQKTRKKHGSKTQGFGGVEQYRGGLGEGCGQVRFHKHKWTYVTKHKSGCSSKNVCAEGPRGKMNVMDVDVLNEMTDQLSTKKEKDKFFNALENLDYTMPVCAGNPTKSLVAKTPFCSKLADEKKIEVGGQTLIENEKLESGR